MRFRYRPVYGDGRLVAIAFESGDAIFNVYFKEHFYGLRRFPEVRDGAEIETLAAQDYPQEVSGAYRELTFGPVLETDELPGGDSTAEAMHVRDWLRAQRARLELGG